MLSLGDTHQGDSMAVETDLSAPPAPVEAAAAIIPLAYDGATRELFRLWLKVTLLSLATLGFYRFWGRTRIRRYLWSRISLDGDRFEYDGTGGELFRRFVLVGLLVMLPLAALPSAMRLAGWSPVLRSAVTSAEGLVIFYLAAVGYYTGRRYRLSRTTWRGIRGGLDGRALVYGLHAFWSSCLLGITLGLYRPWQNVRLWRYEARHLRFGEQYMSFAGQGRALFRAWGRTYFALLGVGLALVVIFAVLIGVFVVPAAWMMAGQLKPGAAGYVKSYIILSVLTGIVMAVLFLAARILWIAATNGFEFRWLQHQAGLTEFGTIRLRLRDAADRRALRRLRIGNFLLSALTLNLAWPFVAHRQLAFLCHNLEARDPATLEALAQRPGLARPPASGLAELFDTGGFA
jgi:uncharacterized membrane protein YjgN (DUF898 family)